MNKFYIIAPIILTGVFAFFYSGFTKEYLQEKADEAQQKQEIADAEAAAKKEAERIAKEESNRRTAEREANEAAKLAEKREKWAAVGQEIADSTAKYKAEADKLAKQAAELELALLAVRNNHLKLSSEAFELMKKVEAGRIAQRTAELQEQRMIAMVADAAKKSHMAKMPPPPPPVPAN